MSIHSLFNHSTCQPTEVVCEPELREGEIRAAVLQSDGREMYVHGLLNEHAAMNPTVGTQRKIRELELRERGIRSERKRLVGSLKRTDASRMIVTAKAAAATNALQKSEAAGMILFSMLALWLSNIVLTAYVVRSGADLYATDAAGASKFAAMPIIAALGVKAFELRLVDDATKRLYVWLFYTIGAIAFAIWASAAALMFAPDLSASTDWLTNVDGSRTVGVALVFSHVVGDVCWGYILFSTAEKLLVDHLERIEIPNPRYATLQQRLVTVDAELEECVTARRISENHIQSVASSRTSMQARAELRLDRAEALWLQYQSAALAAGKARFLDPAIKTGD